jgi:DNA (cytosine-5)-methyltransferase 1
VVLNAIDVIFAVIVSVVHVAKYNAIDLFCGVGGMSLGFSNARFRLVAAVEKDPIHALAHAKNFPSCVTVISDVARVSGAQLRDIAGLKPREDVHVLFGGPPCQGFSFGGKKDPNDPRNVGILEFARLVRELRPLYFVMENVDGLFAPVAAPVVSMFLGLIAHAGYRIVAPIRALDAADFGVPQWRRRVFFLGYRKGCAPPAYPMPLAKHVTVQDAIGDLPRFSKYKRLFDDHQIRAPLRTPSSYARGLRDESQDAENYLLTACRLTEHDQTVQRRFASTAMGAQEPVSRFFKLHPGQQTTTLRAGTDISRGRFTAPRPIHPSEPRCITVREAARLHSFPDSFQFNPTIWHGFRQIGNAVPPRLALAVATQIKNALDGS